MRGSELLDKLELVDPAYVAEADRPMKTKRHWKVWGSLAACLCVVVGAAAIWSGGHTQSVPITPAPIVQSPEMGWDRIVWNKEENGMVVDQACRPFEPGFFMQELKAEELEKLVPVLARGLTDTGKGAFDGEGKLLYVELSVKTALPDAPVTVRISQNFVGPCYAGENYERSRYEGVEYGLFCQDLEDRVRLEGEAMPGDLVTKFYMEVPTEQQEAGKTEFLRVLRAFAAYQEQKPDLTQIVPERIPAWIDRELTMQEALADPTFGRWALPASPQGFKLERNWRSMSEYEGVDLLSQCWTRGYDQLDWRVEHFTPDQQARLVRPEEREKYDMARYPIPLCDSVPEELREVVDHPIFEAHELTREMVWARAYRVKDTGDTDGWRIGFSVRYGDILVTVRAKGVDPDWIYDRLCQLGTD